MLSRKTTIWLFILLAVISAATWVEICLLPGKTSDSVNSILSFTPSSIDAFSIKTADFFIFCTKAGNSWKIDEPVKYRADTSRVNFVLDTISKISKEERITRRQRKNRKLNLADYGLVSPRAQLLFKKESKETEIQVGADAPGGGKVFILTSDSTDVFVVDRIIFDILPVAKSDFRERALLPTSISDISEIEIRQPGKDLVHLKRTDRGWHLENLSDIKAYEPAVEALLRSIQNSAVDEFIWDPPHRERNLARIIEETGAAYGLSLGESPLSASLKYNGARETIEFTFGKSVPNSPGKVYVISSLDNSIFSVGQSILDALKMGSETFRDHRIFSFRSSEVSYISFESAKSVFAMKYDKQLSTWSITRPARLPTSNDAANSLIASVLNLNDETVADIDPEDLSQTNGTDTFKLEIQTDGKHISTYISKSQYTNETDSLEIIIPEKGKRFKVDQKSISENFLSDGWFASIRDKTILAIPPDSITSISKRTVNETEVALRDTAEEWISAKPYPAAIETNSLYKILASVSKLEASDIKTLFPSDKTYFDLEPPAIEFTISSKSGENPITILQLGSPQPDGTVYAQVKGEDSIFSLPEDTSKVLSANFVTDITNNPAEKEISNNNEKSTNKSADDSGVDRSNDG